MPGTPKGKAMKDKFTKINTSVKKAYRQMTNAELQNLLANKKFFDKDADTELKRREKKHKI